MRQYIGARYVAKFYEGSNGAVWDQGVMYEPLIIVEWLNNYYISKKTVPATVGSPNMNLDYWANIGLLGELHNDVVELRTDVDAMEEDITDLKDDVSTLDERVDALEEEVNGMICIGDSYGNDSGEWIDLLKDIVNVPSDKFFSRAVAGAGFVGGYLTDNDFLSNLQTLADTMTAEQKRNISHIVVCGGANDHTATDQSTLAGKIQGFCTYCKTTFPNAQVCIGFIGCCFNGESIVEYQNAMRVYQQAKQFGSNARYLCNVEWIMYNRDYMSSDNLHPNADGSIALARGIGNAIVSGSCDVIYGPKVIDADGFTTTETFHNGIVTLRLGQINWPKAKLPETITTNGTVFTVSNNHMLNYAYVDPTTPLYINANGGLFNTTPTLYNYFLIQLEYAAGTWKLYLYYIDSTGNWPTVTTNENCFVRTHGVEVTFSLIR